ncbi:hypothetical protein [Nitrospira sp. BLG_2]|uniref:hypothetical protein n=1 Tax=Nitrospira sp. BLG_2 TaxID=3397507 RepID=UPI003B9CB08F
MITEEIMKQVRMIIYTGLLTLVNSKTSYESKIVINSDADDKTIEMIAITKEVGIKSLFEIEVMLEEAAEVERIKVNVVVLKHSINDNPHGTFTVSSNHTLFLALQKEDATPETLPHPSFVVEYIANDIVGLGVY